MLGSTVVNPTYATVTPSGQSLYTYATPAPSVTKALEVPPSGTTRVAAVWYSGSSFTIDVNVASGHTYDLELYFLDYDARGRSETVTLSDANTSATLNTQTVSSFASGKYLTWAISGNVLITITTLTGAARARSSAVCSSIPSARSHRPSAPAASASCCNGELHRYGHVDAGQLDQRLRQPGIQRAWQHGGQSHLCDRHAVGSDALYLCDSGTLGHARRSRFHRRARLELRRCGIPARASRST